MIILFLKNPDGYNVATLPPNTGVSSIVNLCAFIHVEMRPYPNRTFLFTVMPYLYMALKHHNFEYTFYGGRYAAHIRGKVVTIEEMKFYSPGGDSYTISVWQLVRIANYWGRFCRGDFGKEYLFSDELEY